MAEDNQAPLQWKTGRIQEIYPGNEDIVRMVKVKTATGQLIRPVAKVRKLPLSTTDSRLTLVYRITKTSNTLHTAKRLEKAEFQGLNSPTYDVPRKYCSAHRKPIHIEGERT